MNNNKIATMLLILSIIGNISLPSMADEEVMVLPPINGNDMQTSAPQTTQYSPTLIQGTVSTVPVGSSFEVITNSDISTKNNHVGEVFTATLNQSITVGSEIVIPAGSEVYGQITYSEDAGRAGRNALMEIKFTSIKPPYGNKIPMMGKIVTKDDSGVLKGGSLKQQLAKGASTIAVTTAGGLATGLGIGAIASEAGAGAAIGSAAGGVLGLGYVIARKGKEVSLPIGTKMIVTLEQPLNIAR